MMRGLQKVNDTSSRVCPSAKDSSGKPPASSHISYPGGMNSAGWVCVMAGLGTDSLARGTRGTPNFFYRPGISTLQKYGVVGILFFAFITTIQSGIVFAQLPGGGDGSPFEVTIIPPSPEAAALAKYADIPVSLYSGTPNISIPLYEIKERELSLPISLNYHGSGNKVETVATRTGLGWTLDAGGIVARTVRGWPDENGQRGFLYQAQQHDVGDFALGTPDQQYQWYDAMVGGCMDAEPDLFYFNVGGYAGKFMFNWNGDLEQVSGNSIKIEPIGLVVGALGFIQGWKITVDDGTTFTFQAIETTEVIESFPGYTCQLGSNEKNMPQAWFLTEMRSANQQSWIHFEYDSYFQQNEMWSLETQVHNAALSPATPNRERLKVNNSGQNLKRITTSSGQCIVEFLPGAQRTDISGNINYTLGEVNVKNINNKQITHWVFNYTYSTGRLTLVNVTESAGGLTKPPYEFSYYSGTLPSTTSFARDHWGFLNDNGAQTMIPATKAFRIGDPNPVDLTGASREPSPSAVLCGMLKQISYPTGGKDFLEFESHDYSFEQNHELVKEVTVARSVNGSAPAWGTPPGTDYVDQKNFTLTGTTDVAVTASFNYGVIFGGGTYIPSLTIKNGQGTVIYNLAPGGAAGTSNTIVHTLYNLPAGTYQMTVQVKMPPPILGVNSITVDLGWQEDTGVQTTEIRPGGGVRIAKITRSFGNGNPSKITKYNYRVNENGRVKSSGSLLESGYIYEMWMLYAIPSGLGYITENRFFRFSQNKTALGTTQGSHVGYSHVTVLAGENGENGKSLYHYTSARDFTDYQTFDLPFPPSYSVDYKRGLLLDQTDFAAGSIDTLRKIKQTYLYYADDVPAIKVGMRIPGGGPRGPGFLDRYAVGTYETALGYSRLKESHETIFQSSTPPVETITTYTFDETTHKQLVSTSTNNSKQETIVTSYKYPLDYSTTTGAIAMMKTRNMANVIIEKLIWKKGTGAQVYLLSGIKTDFTNNNNKVLPYIKYSTKITQPILTTNPFGTVATLYEPRLYFTGYNAYGNVIEHTPKYGLKTSYQWNYAGTLPTAKVDNASYKQIFYTSFEEDATATTVQQKTGQKSKAINGMYAIPNANRPLINGNYMLSYWTKEGSGPWTYKEKAIPNYVTGAAITSDAINGYVDEVRLYPTGALMTTYTYDPLTGTTSSTDAGNVTTYYEYDDFSRLKFIRDQNNNIKESYDYEYRVEVLYAIPGQ